MWVVGESVSGLGGLYPSRWQMLAVSVGRKNSEKF